MKILARSSPHGWQESNYSSYGSCLGFLTCVYVYVPHIFWLSKMVSQIIIDNFKASEKNPLMFLHNTADIPALVRSAQ